MRWSVGIGCAVLIATLSVTATPSVSAGTTGASEVDYRDLRDSDAEIFMDVDATRRESDAIRRELRSWPAVEAFAFLDHHDALAEARRIFKDDKEFVRSLEASVLPTSFRVRFGARVDRDEFENRFELQRAVDEVKWKSTKEQVRKARAAAARNRVCRGDVDAEVFMTVGATTAQEEGVAAVLGATDGVESVERVSREEAKSTLECLFPNESPPTPESLPVSFRLRIRSLTVLVALEQTVADMPGVDDIQY